MVTVNFMVGFLAEQKTIKMTVTWKIKKSHRKNAFFSLLFLNVSSEKFSHGLLNLTFFFRFLENSVHEILMFIKNDNKNKKCLKWSRLFWRTWIILSIFLILLRLENAVIQLSENFNDSTSSIPWYLAAFCNSWQANCKVL